MLCALSVVKDGFMRKKAEKALAEIEHIVRVVDFGWVSYIEFWNCLARIIEKYKDYPKHSIKRRKEL